MLVIDVSDEITPADYPRLTVQTAYNFEEYPDFADVDDDVLVVFSHAMLMGKVVLSDEFGTLVDFDLEENYV